MERSTWDRESRIVWERKLADTVGEETAKISGLEQYRTVPVSEGPLKDRFVVQGMNMGVRPAPHLNDLSSDIENGARAIRYDCSVQSAVKGAIMQRVENAMLPQHAGAGAGLKERANYFWFSGSVRFAEDDKAPNAYQAGNNHAFLASGATGNIIEATRNPTAENSSYIAATNPNHSFERLVSGKPFTSSGPGIYGGRFTEQEAQMAKVENFDTRPVYNQLGRLPAGVADEANVPPNVAALIERRDITEDAKQTLLRARRENPGSPQLPLLQDRVKWAEQEFETTARSFVADGSMNDIQGWVMDRRAQALREDRETAQARQQRSPELAATQPQDQPGLPTRP